MHNLKVEVNQRPTVRGHDALDLVYVVELLFIPGRRSVREHQERVVIADLAEGPSGEETLVLRVERRQVNQGGLKVGGWADVLAIPVLLQTERALEEGWTSKVGHFFNQRTTRGGARQTRRVLPQPSVI